MRHLYTNEIVFRGHPDKVCDQISDALLDAYLRQDPHSRCAIEVMGGKNNIFITGEITSKATVDVLSVVTRVLSSIGYDDQIRVINNIGQQSQDIALGTNDTTAGAGDQGMMFGYATSETPQKLPKAMVILQEFSKRYDELVQKGNYGFKPDGKAQITGEYEGEGLGRRLKRIKTILISYQNDEKNRPATDTLLEIEFMKIAKKHKIDVGQFLFNPTGRFEVGGFTGDAGLTGRKIVVDNYHSFANVGGGAFSGKDATKVDRSGAYMARKIAKEILDKGYEFVEVQISYAIGLKEPLSIFINTDKGILTPSQELYTRCQPHKIIQELELLEPKYEELARYGHFQD